jgi:hypothetical protein
MYEKVCPKAVIVIPFSIKKCIIVCWFSATLVPSGLLSNLYVTNSFAVFQVMCPLDVPDITSTATFQRRMLPPSSGLR